MLQPFKANISLILTSQVICMASRLTGFDIAETYLLNGEWCLLNSVRSRPFAGTWLSAS